MPECLRSDGRVLASLAVWGKVWVRRQALKYGPCSPLRLMNLQLSEEHLSVFRLEHRRSWLGCGKPDQAFLPLLAAVHSHLLPHGPLLAAVADLMHWQIPCTGLPGWSASTDPVYACLRAWQLCLGTCTQGGSSPDLPADQLLPAQLCRQAVGRRAASSRITCTL